VVLGPQKGPKNSLKLLYLAVLGGFSPINHGFDHKKTTVFTYLALL